METGENEDTDQGSGRSATGIAARLYRCGHEILMTEIKEPLTVRRTVAFSRAVYEGHARWRTWRLSLQEIWRRPVRS